MATDPLTPEKRSERMSLVRSKDTKPEMAVRSLIHGMGYRYRLHQSDLPGKPDLVFRSRKKVIFVHGCFWHQHPDINCPLARMPKSRISFWKKKLEGNRARDERNLSILENLGWGVLVIWECELREMSAVTERVRDFLDEVG